MFYTNNTYFVRNNVTGLYDVIITVTKESKSYVWFTANGVPYKSGRGTFERKLISKEIQRRSKEAPHKQSLSTKIEFDYKWKIVNGTGNFILFYGEKVSVVLSDSITVKDAYLLRDMLIYNNISFLFSPVLESFFGIKGIESKK